MLTLVWRHPLANGVPGPRARQRRVPSLRWHTELAAKPGSCTSVGSTAPQLQHLRHAARRAGGAALALSALGGARKAPDEIDRRAYTQEHAPKQPIDVAKQPNMMMRETKCTDVPDRCCTSTGYCGMFSGKGPPVCH